MFDKMNYNFISVKLRYCCYALKANLQNKLTK